MRGRRARREASANASSAGEWAWWPTFEHYCASVSTPWGVSMSVARVERAVDNFDSPRGKWGVIAQLIGGQRTVVSKRKAGRTVDLDPRQTVKYDAARAGGSRGNLGPEPPEVEIRVVTRDLDG